MTGISASPHRAHYERGKEVLLAAKAVPCYDCGDTYPPFVMQFDHVRGVKHFTLSNREANRHTRAVLLAEIAKCDIVCANCHLIRTHERDHFDEEGGFIRGRRD